MADNQKAKIGGVNEGEGRRSLEPGLGERGLISSEEESSRGLVVRVLGVELVMGLFRSRCRFHRELCRHRSLSGPV